MAQYIIQPDGSRKLAHRTQPRPAPKSSPESAPKPATKTEKEVTSDANS